MALLPKYFYDINAIVPGNPPRPRWVDEFTDLNSDFIDIVASKARHEERDDRNRVYANWLKGFEPTVSPKRPLWQAIRVIDDKPIERNGNEWFSNYRDAIFRCYVNPETIIDEATKAWRQFYILSPEDCYLVNRYEAEALGISGLKPRDYNGKEKWISSDRRLRMLRAIPTECCSHLRNESFAGKLLEGL